MYAVVEIAGTQYKVAPADKIFVPLLATEIGKKISFANVLVTAETDAAVKFGTPYIKGAIVEATVLDHTKGDKVIVFKKKRRKGYKVKNGHRQNYTQIEINSIIA